MLKEMSAELFFHLGGHTHASIHPVEARLACKANKTAAMHTRWRQRASHHKWGLLNRRLDCLLGGT